MVRWVWLSLFSVFLIYTVAVYFYCDDDTSHVDAKIVSGMNTWQDKNCQSCHQLYGLGGYMGPDLTNTFSANGKGAQYMQSFIKHGTGKMPNFNLTDAEVSNIIAFLAWVDRSGRSKVPASAVHWSGTYHIPN